MPSRARGELPGGRARILSCGAYVPERVLTNEELSARLDTTDAWIVERTGIRQRRVAAAGERASDMATRAARDALDAAGLDASQLALLVVGTISADQRLPSCAAHVQRKLGATCPAFDLAAACAGFIYGLDLASRYVATGTGPVLVVGVELLSRLLDWEDRETCVIFGDGAGAAVVDGGAGEGEGLLGVVLGADGRHADLLQIPEDEGVVRMKGREVFRLAVTELSRACSRVLEDAGLSPGDVDLVVAHQANLRILEALARRTGIPFDRFHITIDKYGNTSSASVPIGLADALARDAIRQGGVVLMAALGAGAAWAAAVARFDRREPSCTC